jgi:hypothetical protein
VLAAGSVHSTARGEAAETLGKSRCCKNPDVVNISQVGIIYSMDNVNHKANFSEVIIKVLLLQQHLAIAKMEQPRKSQLSLVRSTFEHSNETPFSFIERI